MQNIVLMMGLAVFLDFSETVAKAEYTGEWEGTEVPLHEFPEGNLSPHDLEKERTGFFMKLTIFYRDQKKSRMAAPQGTAICINSCS